jgi:hypothetical protein
MIGFTLYLSGSKKRVFISIDKEQEIGIKR